MAKVVFSHVRAQSADQLVRQLNAIGDRFVQMHYIVFDEKLRVFIAIIEMESE